MNTKPLLHTILFSSMLAVSFTATAAQDASTNGSASGSANASITASANGSLSGSAKGTGDGSANGASSGSASGSADAGANVAGPAGQLATRYAQLVGSTEAAAELVQQLHVDSDTGAIMRYAEIDNALALTSAMLDSGAATNVDAALATVMRLRADGTTWNAVAQKLGYKLGTVVSTAHRTGAAGAASTIAGAGNSLDLQGSAASATAASAGLQDDLARGAAADATANKRIDAGLLGSASGRAGGMSAPTLPQVPQLPSLPRIGL